jgi:hypothetical protein
LLRFGLEPLVGVKYLLFIYLATSHILRHKAPWQERVERGEGKHGLLFLFGGGEGEPWAE